MDVLDVCDNKEKLVNCCDDCRAKLAEIVGEKEPEDV